MLCNVKDRHGDVERVRDQHDSHECLKDPFEKDPGFKVCQVVVFNDQLDQLIAGDEREEHARDGNDDRFGDVADEAEHRRPSAASCPGTLLMCDKEVIEV